MKNIFTLLIIAVFILPVTANAKDRNGSMKAIEQAESILKNIDADKDLKYYIPGDQYNEAVINIINARTQWDKGEYLSSYYLATLATIKLDAATNIAKARDNKNKKLLLENAYYKKHPSGGLGSKFIAILDANLIKKGDIFTVSILDKDLFKPKEFKLSDEGKIRMGKIIEVLKLFPEIKIKIAGHSSSFDYKTYTKYKADAVAKYISSYGINPDNISSVGMGNIEVMETPVGFKRLDRIEIVITGIKL